MNNFSKHEWVALFKEIGLSEDQMIRWHQIFESKHPETHQKFLEWLNIDENEIKKIRKL
ncbi:MAG TPA: hypothetical protein QF753_07350 [Victivallales bacterium]|nr:hypothetical protein [Victivallales bacterium]